MTSSIHNARLNRLKQLIQYVFIKQTNDDR
jgi:hypothetical protein